MQKIHTYMRILAIRPTRRGFGFAVREGARLIDWGVANVWATNEKEFVARVEAYVDRYKPALIVLELVAYQRRGGIGPKRVVLVAEFAEQRQIAVARVSRDDVRRALNMACATKQELARALAGLFPDLEPHVPPPKKPWMSEDERMNLFEAVGMVIASAAR